MNRQDFEALVLEAIAELPEDIRARIDNMDVVIQDTPRPDDLRRAGLPHGRTLLGLYQGVPLTKRTSRYGLVLPDKITLFQRSIERVARTPATIRERVRRTFLHELGHHFGLGEEQLRELGV